MVILILTVHCLGYIFQKLLWSLLNITIHLIEWHCTGASSAEWGIVTPLAVPSYCWRNKLLQFTLNCLCVCAFYWVAGLLCSLNHLEKSIIWACFSGFKRKRLLKINPIHGYTDILSHSWAGGICPESGPLSLTCSIITMLGTLLTIDTWHICFHWYIFPSKYVWKAWSPILLAQGKIPASGSMPPSRWLPLTKKAKSNRGWPSSPLEPSEGAFELAHGSACIII